MSKSTEIRSYIAFRYNNWLDYSLYSARTNGISGWGRDLLDEVIINLLNKPEDKIYGMLSKETKKMINGKPTTELDKFVLRMINVNAYSTVAPFRKNVIGNKIYSRCKGKATPWQRKGMDGVDMEDEGYDKELCDRLDKMHHDNIQRLQTLRYTALDIGIYRKYFCRNEVCTCEEMMRISVMVKDLKN